MLVHSLSVYQKAIYKKRSINRTFTRRSCICLSARCRIAGRLPSWTQCWATNSCRFCLDWFSKAFISAGFREIVLRWMVRISVPRCSKCLVKLCRNVCALTLLVISVWRTACFIALLIADWSRWWRRIIQLRGSFERPRTGNTYCGVLDLRLIGINQYIYLISCSSSTNQANLSEYSVRG